MTTSHMARVGVWRFTIDAERFVDAAGHVAFEAFERARPKLAKLLGREPTLNDLGDPIVVADDCMAPFVAFAATTWDVLPQNVLVLGRRPTRALTEARAACLLMAIAKWELDVPTLARAVGWPVKTVGQYVEAAKGRGGRSVRKRLEQIKAGTAPEPGAAP